MNRSSPPETFCYEKRCEYNFMDKWCMSYKDIKLYPLNAKGSHAHGTLQCKDFKLKGEKDANKNLTNNSNALVSLDDIVSTSLRIFNKVQ